MVLVSHIDSVSVSDEEVTSTAPAQADAQPGLRRMKSVVSDSEGDSCFPSSTTEEDLEVTVLTVSLEAEGACDFAKDYLALEEDIFLFYESLFIYVVSSSVNLFLVFTFVFHFYCMCMSA